VKVKVLIPVFFFAMAAIAPVGSRASVLLFGVLFVLGWVTAVRIGKPILAFYGSLGVLLIAMLPIGIR
jgi:hypothetical protein